MESKIRKENVWEKWKSILLRQKKIKIVDCRAPVTMNDLSRQTTQKGEKEERIKRRKENVGYTIL